MVLVRVLLRHINFTYYHVTRLVPLLFSVIRISSTSYPFVS
jgi:hypothetical protein